MSQRIIYPTEGGGIAIIIPALECGLPTGEIARKDVPAGLPFVIIEATDIPEDRSTRAAWEADFSNPHGYGIGADAWFAEQDAANQAQEDPEEIQ